MTSKFLIFEHFHQIWVKIGRIWSSFLGSQKISKEYDEHFRTPAIDLKWSESQVRPVDEVFFSKLEVWMGSFKYVI